MPLPIFTPSTKGCRVALCGGVKQSWAGSVDLAIGLGFANSADSPGFEGGWDLMGGYEWRATQDWNPGGQLQESGKVLVNEARARPDKTVGEGDLPAIRLGPYTFVVEVQGISDKRGPAPQTQLLYRETPESIEQREALAFERKAQEQRVARGEGRPTKKDRRDIERFHGGAW